MATSIPAGMSPSPSDYIRATLAWWRSTFSPCRCGAELDVRIERGASSPLLGTRGANPLSSTGVVTVFDDRISSILECGRCAARIEPRS